MTSFRVKRPLYGGYSATSGCAYTHPFEGMPSVSSSGHGNLYYCTTFCTTTIVRKKRRKSKKMLENDVTSCDVTSGDVISDHVGHCVVYSSSIYGFRLPLWYLQTLLTVKLQENHMVWKYNVGDQYNLSIFYFPIKRQTDKIQVIQLIIFLHYILYST